MVKVIPFKGVAYNPIKIDNLDDVMSPPYDIITQEMQEDFYNLHTNNFVRLIFGKQFSTDSEFENRYSRSKKDYNNWLKTKILKQSDKPALYPYRISYELAGKIKEMNGFFSLLRLDKNYDYVKAHERTLNKPKADRLDLMRACNSNLEPIQLLYIDEQNRILNTFTDAMDKKPIIDVKGYDNCKHTIWKITDNELISKIQQFLNDKILFIADGHHRYQTSINYAEEQIKKTGNTSENAPFNYRMVILVNMYDTGLTILPTHRLIKYPSISQKILLKEIIPFFNVEKINIDDSRDTTLIVNHINKKLIDSNKHKFALFFKNVYYILTLKDEKIMDKFANNKSKIWRTLDVSILHKIIIEHILGISQETLENHVKYTRNNEEALSLVIDGSYDFSILMNPTKIKELKAIAEGGEHMPQKSTYFLPKMLSGLVIYKMNK